MPVLFPVLEEGCKSCYDVDWFCVADEDYIFDKVKMQLYYERNRSLTSDFVVAVEGKEFEYFKSTNYHSFILDKAVVYARFNPDNKKDLIEEYSKSGFVTMFCGDGANDTGALCSADVGLSLATNEASLAASFNSKNLSSVLDVVKEGRSALIMSAAQFKYIFYSQVLAGFQMLSLLPQLFFPSDVMSLINDLMSCYVLAYALSNFKCADKIHPKKISIDLRVDAFYMFVELLGLLTVFSFTSFFISANPDLEQFKVILKSKQSGAVFISTMVLLVYRSLKFANFGPHRQRLRNNNGFICVFFACCCVSASVIYFIFSDNLKVLEMFKINQLEMTDKFKACTCLILSLFITLISDYFEKQNKVKSKS
jgi:cation-transporting ATPase 13A2